MDPSPILADRGSDDVDERGDVVIGGLLPLLDRVDRERRALADAGRVDAGMDACQHVHDRELDLEPVVELALLRPHRAHLRARVPIDHTSMIRAAKMAALRAPLTATHATGTPGGICAIASIASSPPATDAELVSGTPTPGSAAARPAPAMITFSPRRCAFFA